MGEPVSEMRYPALMRALGSLWDEFDSCGYS
jgi:hypothetical protein